MKLPGFKSLLSHFTQPGKIFADELADRLKVIACLERPNLFHTEEIKPTFPAEFWETPASKLKTTSADALIVFRGPEADIETALDVISERCLMAFEGVPGETRKALTDGTTIFERVLPGADRMYPDTDSAPIPLSNEYIETLRKTLPSDIVVRFKQMQNWKIPQDTYTYILSKNLYPLIEKIINQLGYDPLFTGTFFGHYLKFVEGHYRRGREFDYEIIYGLFKFVKDRKLVHNILFPMLPIIFEQPQMEFNSVLTDIRYKTHSKDEIMAPVEFLREKYKEIGRKQNIEAENNWIMGELRNRATGNLDFTSLMNELKNQKS